MSGLSSGSLVYPLPSVHDKHGGIVPGPRALLQAFPCFPSVCGTPLPHGRPHSALVSQLLCMKPGGSPVSGRCGSTEEITLGLEGRGGRLWGQYLRLWGLFWAPRHLPGLECPSSQLGPATSPRCGQPSRVRRPDPPASRAGTGPRPVQQNEINCVFPHSVAQKNFPEAQTVSGSHPLGWAQEGPDSLQSPEGGPAFALESLWAFSSSVC